MQQCQYIRQYDCWTTLFLPHVNDIDNFLECSVAHGFEAAFDFDIIPYEIGLLDAFNYQYSHQEGFGQGEWKSVYEFLQCREVWIYINRRIMALRTYLL